MQFPPEVAFRGFEADEWLKDTVHEEIAKLDDYFDRIIGCRVMVELPHQRREEGNPYHVRIELSVPGRNLVVNRSTMARERERETQMTALDEAFAAIRRRLEDYVRELRGDVKVKQEQAQGRIWRLYPAGAEGGRYGFIRTPDGGDVYFHENSLLESDFDDVDVGAQVRFHEEQGVEGPQASTVRVVQGPWTPAPATDGDGGNGAQPGDRRESGEAREPLSVENAERLLQELADTVTGLSADEPDSQRVEEIEKLLRSLDDFPGPPALLRDPVEELRAWTRILLENHGSKSQGPGGPADVVEHQIYRVREVLEREKTLTA